MDILIYGVGGFTRWFLPATLEILAHASLRLIGFVDQKAEEYPNGYEGIAVYKPSDLPGIEYDSIYIYASEDAGVYQSIYQSLRREYHVSENKIGNIADLLRAAQRYNRERFCRAQSRNPEIYDCFQFYNEIDILHMRMEILNPYVDHFVLVEMSRDHHGNRKPLYFMEHMEEFRAYKDKIIYVRPDEGEIPGYRESDRNRHGHVWTIERFQRRCIAKGLEDAQPEDVILISDCDEIPNPKILRDVRLNSGKAYPDVVGKLLEETAIALRQEYYYFFLNCRNKVRRNTTTLVKYKNMINPQIIRAVMDCLPYIDHGGWHLTYFGGVENIKRKVHAIVEGTEVSEELILERITNAQDIYGRVGEEFELEFLARDEITIPDAGKWIERYPGFYLQRG